MLTTTSDDLDELDISYPGNVVRSFYEYFEFAYLMSFHFLAEVTQAPAETSSLFICNTSLYSWRDDLTFVQRIYTDFDTWRPREKTANNVKPILFAHVGLLELIYPTSKECSSVNREVYDYIDAYNLAMNNPESLNLIPMNFFKNMGTILADIVQLDKCFELWDGQCAGERLGRTTFKMLDPSIKQVFEELESETLLP